MMNKTRQTLIAALTAGAMMGAAAPAVAQGLFAPVVKVDNQVVTRFELQQRIAFLRVLNTPGDLNALARQQLIEDRLKTQAARAVGLELPEDAVTQGVAEFAARANLTSAEFLRLAAQDGVAKETVFDFVRTGQIWRELVRARFGRRVSVTDDDIDRAIAALGSETSLQVLLSEVIIPLQQGYEARITEIAEGVAKINSFNGFTEAAQRFSAAPTRENGGRLEWLPISQLPAPLRPVLLGLEPGETTQVIPMQGALAVFQLRAVAESPYRAPKIAAVEYATLTLPGGRTDANLAEAARIASAVDSCDDLYGENYGKDASLLSVTSAAPEDIPGALAIELAKLDAGETSANLSTDTGDVQLVTLCGRSPVLGQEASREEVTNRLRAQQLESFANGYLAELRSNARIVSK
ncbi:peptidylprolyl isomerase [Thalassobius sp. Cn5-15]|uniref:peptidylprolyl isomerase n=1 Tax=Thalassobius sp. Cn5-15 TaxID=2917763 RepID=UPI001EF301FD|nr:peptidylprolyl isomerase [Thalassobius sp. Cn5-15]MCG7492302.1 peptidylprolyl isomerase [Thalassobius sp. Cn5-15]